MLLLAACLSTTLYLVPIAALLVVRARSDRALWEVALDLPLGVALDLLILLALSRLVTLEMAVLVSRPLWLMWVVACMVRRWRRHPAVVGGTRWAGWRNRLSLAWPRSLGRRDLMIAALAAALAVAASVEFSSLCHSYDRAWHIPLASSIRGQTLPFANVYEPDHALAYHFSGDALAAALQVLSGARLHISYSLSLAHDIMFGLAAATTALLGRWLGIRRVVPAAIGGLVPLLFGPLVLLVPNGRHASGYNFPTLLKLSFRPHSSLAVLLLVAVMATVLVRLRKGEDPPALARTGGVLVACTALLSVTDEASIGVFGLALGLTWLLVPSVIHPRRLHGMLVLLALLGVVVGANLLYNGALVAGEMGGEVAWVPARAPGYYKSPIGWDDPRALETLTWDLLPMVTLWFTGLLTLLRWRNREQLGAVLFFTALLLLSVGLLTHIDMGQRSLESHRFATAAMVLFPLGGIFWLTASGARRRDHGWGLRQTLIVATLAIAAVCGGDWLRRATKPRAKTCATSAKYFSAVELFDVDCRKMAGARLGQRPAVTYVQKDLSYVYAGCHSLYAAGPKPKIFTSDRIDLKVRGKVAQWHARIGRMLTGHAALNYLNDHVLSDAEPLLAICRPGSTDGFCSRALRAGVCQPLAESMQRCPVSGEQRRTWLGEMRVERASRGKTRPPQRGRGPK